VARESFKGGKRDVQRWQERRSEGGKRDVLKVARETFQRWQERRCEGGKTDGMRYQLRRGCYGSDTLGRGKNDVLELPAPTWLLWE
jgi:hypothetical protein